MTDNKNYNIYKFDIRFKKLQDKKLSEDEFYQVMWKRSLEHCKFQIEMFNAFSIEDYKTVSIKYMNPLKRKRVPYKKKGLENAFDICMDMVSEKTGLEYHIISESFVYRVPKAEKNLVNFFENKKPNWAIKLVKI